MRSPKVISDPIYGIIDIRPVIAMTDVEEFQALGDKRQLGMSYLVFPSATHTRKAHSLGAYHATHTLAERWVELGIIGPREAAALAGYALYHDIGHPAFSHVTEPLCKLPAEVKGAEYRRMSMNSALSLAIIRRRKKEIEACGIDFKLLESFAAHRNPLHLAVSDKNLGMEKLDYLERDGLLTILSRPSGVDYLRDHIYFAGGQLAIDEKAVDNALETQNFYLKMYKNVYLRKTSAIAQRMFQKMTWHLILAGELRPEDLPNLTDSELFGIINLSRNEVVQETYGLFKRRDFYREAIVIRPKSFARDENVAGTAIARFGVGGREIHRLMKNPQLQLANQMGLAKIESEIAELADIPIEAVLVVPITNPERFTAQDIMVYRGRAKKPASLKSRYPAHFKNIEEVAQTYVAFRVATPERYRKHLSSTAVANKILKLILA